MDRSNTVRPTRRSPIAVQAGDTIDFVTDCRKTSHRLIRLAGHLVVQVSGQPVQAIASADQFGGPVESTAPLPGQIVRAWQLAYCRQPTKDEFAMAVQFVSHQIEAFASSRRRFPMDDRAFGKR